LVVDWFLSPLAWSSPASATATEPLTLERIFGKTPILAPLPDPTWVGNSKGISLVHEVTPEKGEPKKAFVIRELPSGKERVIAWLDHIPVPDDLKSEEHDQFAIESPSWSRDGSHAAFAFAGDIFTIDRKGKVERITKTEGEEQDPTFSRDGHWLAYTRGHDLYTRDLARGVEIRHTTTGCDTVYNGILNWVYMEELFTRGEMRSYWWSPNGSRLAFLEIRDGMVPEYPIVDQSPCPRSGRCSATPNPAIPTRRCASASWMPRARPFSGPMSKPVPITTSCAPTGWATGQHSPSRR
jgi:dipeptidyl-peptidase-4